MADSISDIITLANLHKGAIKVSHRVCDEVVRHWKTYTSEYTTYDWLKDVEGSLPDNEWKEFVGLWLKATPQERKDWFRAGTEEVETEWDDEDNDSWEDGHRARPPREHDEEDEEERDWSEMPSQGTEHTEFRVAEWARQHITEVSPSLKAHKELEDLTEQLENLKNACMLSVDAAWKTYNEKSETLAKKMFHLKMAEEAARPE